jgi:chromosome segregation ATPase
MRQSILVYILILAALTGCMPAPTPQENYDAAMKNLERVEARLDNLRPAYDAARKQAALQVCEEIAGTTPEASAEGAIANLEALLTDGAAATTTDKSTDEKTDGDAAKTTPPIGDADAALDQLLDAHKQMQEQAAALTAPITKARETMKLINTPGTPEAKRVDELVAKMPEAKAYLRQEKRVARAQKAADEAEALLPGAAAPVK